MSPFFDQSFLFHSASVSPTARRCCVCLGAGGGCVERTALRCAALSALTGCPFSRCDAACSCTLSADTLTSLSRLSSLACRCRCSPPSRPFPLHTCSTLTALASSTCTRTAAPAVTTAPLQPSSSRWFVSVRTPFSASSRDSSSRPTRRSPDPCRSRSSRVSTQKRMGRNEEGWMARSR